VVRFVASHVVHFVFWFFFALSCLWGSILGSVV
jgi:hypothetical protein